MFRANSNPIGGGEAEEAASDIQTAKNINISVWELRITGEH